MKIALIGYGKMGKLIEQIASDKGHQIVAKIGSTSFTPSQVQSADICIDFSHPTAVLNNVKILAKEKKAIVMGTTGWHEHFGEIQALVNQYQIGFFHSPNFSLGVNLFLKIVESAAELINQYDDYDIALSEAHHKEKADSPSGTAKAIADILLKQIKRKKHIVNGDSQGKIPSDALQVSSIRCGAIPGTHTVLFESSADSITLTHQAHNRVGFARGAILAAEWLQGKKGIYTYEDILGGVL